VTPLQTRPNGAHAPLPDALVVLTGLAALAVAMGIGRFAFTPLLPLMLRDGTLGEATGAEWAAANYVGYLLGAMTAARFARDPRRGMQLGLGGVAITTAAVGLLGGSWLPWLGLLLRTAAGVFSAWTLVCVSSWCLGELARRGRARLGAWVYTGVGVGIAVAGVWAWAGGRQAAHWLWLELGALAAAGALFATRQLRRATPGSPPAAAATGAAPPPPPAAGGHAALVWCYGVMGFGYIVQATFLPAMARQQVSDPLVFGLTWPLFGLAAALSVAVAARWLSAWPRRRVWALAQGTMALGTALPLATTSLAALALSAVFVGGTFMVATMAGLQLARERASANPTPLLARMTMAFAIGQIAGPVLVRLIAAAGAPGPAALLWANGAATVLLAGTAAWLWRGGARRAAAGG